MSYAEIVPRLWSATLFPFGPFIEAFKVVIDTLTNPQLQQKVQSVVQTITDLPRAIWGGILALATALWNAGVSLAAAVKEFVDFVNGGLAWLWVCITSASAFAWKIISFTWNTVQSMLRIIWERKLDFLAALKTSMIAYYAWEHLKSRYAGDPLKMMIYGMGLELAQPLMYWFNKTLLHSMYSAMHPKYQLVTTGPSAGMVLALAPEKIDRVDYVSYWDKVVMTAVTIPTVHTADTLRWYDSVETSIASTASWSDTVTYSDAVELALTVTGTVTVT